MSVRANDLNSAWDALKRDERFDINQHEIISGAAFPMGSLQQAPQPNASSAMGNC